MRIVHIVRQFYPGVGGLENFVLDLAAAQVNRGHDVRVVTLDRLFAERGNGLASSATHRGISIARVPFRGSERYPIAPGVLGQIRDRDLVHVHAIDFFFDFLAVTAPIHRRPLVASTHGGFFHTSFAAPLKEVFFRTITRTSARSYRAVIAGSRNDLELFRQIRPENLVFIESGCDTRKLRDSGAAEPRRRMLALGRFALNKRLDRLVAFLAALRALDPRWSLIIAGSESDFSERHVRRWAEREGVSEAVRIVVRPSDDEVRRLTGQCSVFVSASEYEGFGIAAIEGLSAGLMPVLSDIPPHRAVVENTGVGLTVDMDALPTAAQRFLAHWDDIQNDYSARRARAVAASARYDWSAVAGSFDEVYERALGISVRSILGVPVRVAERDQAVQMLDERVTAGAPVAIAFANAHTLNVAKADHRARDALVRLVVLNDGLGIDMASRLLFGRRFPHNLNGTDFVPHFLASSRYAYRIFLLGSRPGIAERAAERIRIETPQHEIVGIRHGYLADGECERVAAEILSTRAHVLLVALGNPRQEVWLSNHFGATGCCLGFAVGALFDFLAGEAPRAPFAIRRWRMEWVYRLAREPMRLWRRYLIGNAIFLARVGWQWLAGVRL